MPRADDFHPVLGPVVTARRYPTTSCPIPQRHGRKLLALKPKTSVEHGRLRRALRSFGTLATTDEDGAKARVRAEGCGLRARRAVGLIGTARANRLTLRAGAARQHVRSLRGELRHMLEL